MTEKGNGSFEERLQQAETLIAEIESGKLSLEESVKKYEAGMKALAEMEEELKEMNRRITVLQDGKEEEMAPGGEHEDL